MTDDTSAPAKRGLGVRTTGGGASAPSLANFDRDTTDYEPEWLGDQDDGETFDARMDDERARLSQGESSW
ncbi:MAG: hypothetical protein KGR26_11195 [Cyanobacteria bacterium REEB65]|nr:hypothetical protein [Cyanobacteria bacterium REEB65]